MKQKPSSRRKRSSTKSVLGLLDLEHAKAAVLNSLNSTDAKRGYRDAIEFPLGHISVQTTERSLGCKQRIRPPVNDRMGIEPNP